MLTTEKKASLQTVVAVPDQPRRPRFSFSLATPAIIYLVLLTQIPVLFTLYYSFSNWNFLRPDRTRFVGAGNYLDFIQDADTLTIIQNTLVFASSVVILTLAFGMLLALLLNRQFRGRGVARTLLITPFLIMPTPSPLIVKNLLFNPSLPFICP